MKIISWNIRGMGSSVKKRFLAKLIKERRPDMCMIQETKLERVDKGMVQRVWGDFDVDFADSGAVGASGGILIMWNKDVFKPQSVTSQRNLILITGMFLGFECALMSIYAPNEDGDRRRLWDDILVIKNASNVPWCVGGILMRSELWVKGWDALEFQTT